VMSKPAVGRISAWLQHTVLRAKCAPPLAPFMMAASTQLRLDSFSSTMTTRNASTFSRRQLAKPLCSLPASHALVNSARHWGESASQNRSFATGRQFFASVGKVADPAPLPPTEPVPFQERAKQFPTKAARQIKTFANIYRIRSAIGSDSNFSAKSFVEEAAGIYRKFMAALNRLDKHGIRQLVTEDFFARIKKQLPEKEERKQRRAAQKEQPQPTFVTGDVSFVQARIVTLTVEGDHRFAQVTCDVTLIRPELQFVRLVFERALHAEAGEWRICDLQPLPAAL